MDLRQCSRGFVTAPQSFSELQAGDGCLGFNFGLNHQPSLLLNMNLFRSSINRALLRESPVQRAYRFCSQMIWRDFNLPFQGLINEHCSPLDEGL